MALSFKIKGMLREASVCLQGLIHPRDLLPKSPELMMMMMSEANMVTDLAVTFKVVTGSKKRPSSILANVVYTSFVHEDKHPSLSHFLSTFSRVCSASHILYNSGTQRIQSPDLLIG